MDHPNLTSPESIIVPHTHTYTHTQTRSTHTDTVHGLNLAFHRRSTSLPAPAAPSRSSSPAPQFLRDLRTGTNTASSRSVSHPRLSFLTSQQPLYLFLLLLLVLVLPQFFFPHLPFRLAILRSPQDKLVGLLPAAQVCSPPPPAVNPFLDSLICPQPQIEQPGTLYNDAPRTMGLAQEASRVAQEFEYSAQDVNKGVKEFIRQMSRSCVQLQRRWRLFFFGFWFLFRLLLTRLSRRGTREIWTDHEPDPYLCHRSAQWYRKGKTQPLPNTNLELVER